MKTIDGTRGSMDMISDFIMQNNLKNNPNLS